MRKVHVVVTEEDIKNGKPLDNNNCPIALALRRQIEKDVIKVFTGNCDICIIKNGWDAVGAGYWEETVETASNPPEVTDFIKAFDANWNVDKIKPFEFDLEFREL